MYYIINLIRLTNLSNKNFSLFKKKKKRTDKQKLLNIEIDDELSSLITVELSNYNPRFGIGKIGLICYCLYDLTREFRLKKNYKDNNVKIQISALEIHLSLINRETG